LFFVSLFPFSFLLFHSFPCFSSLSFNVMEALLLTLGPPSSSHSNLVF
jgi:hypothetical protein